jgi:hypothetical protein
MIQLENVRGSRLTEAAKYDLFLARDRSDPTFIVGTTNNRFPVAVNLTSGTYEMVDLEATKGRRGLIISNHIILIDPSSREPYLGINSPDMPPLGRLVLNQTNVGILAENPRHSSRHCVTLINDEISDDCTDGTAFADWAVCVRDETGEWTTLYKNGPNAARGLS